MNSFSDEFVLIMLRSSSLKVDIVISLARDEVSEFKEWEVTLLNTSTVWCLR